MVNPASRLLSLAAAVACWLAPTTGAASTPGDARTGWSDRGVFAFGDIVLDLELGRTAYGPDGGRAADCSTDAVYCVRAAPFSLVLPRRCEPGLATGRSWRNDEIETRVLGVVDEPAGHHLPPGGKLYVLRTTGADNVAYLYTGGARGVVGVLYSERGPLQLPSAGQLTYASLVGSQRALYRPLRTFDAFGGCTR